MKVACKFSKEYGRFGKRTEENSKETNRDDETEDPTTADAIAEIVTRDKRNRKRGRTTDIVRYEAQRKRTSMATKNLPKSQIQALALRRKMENTVRKPQWHPHWKLMRVVAGHLGWVRSIAVDPGNEWFATGSVDRTIKIWDLASSKLKLTLTGHLHAVRALQISNRHPYLFSAGEDKMVKCWDLEQNMAIRHYHGHFSGVCALAIHPTLDLIVTGGRDSSARVWDMRTRHEVMTLTGHHDAVMSIIAQGVDPQVVTASMDRTIRLWDIRKANVSMILTHHKKSVRALVGHPTEFTMASGAADSLKKWLFPRGKLMKTMKGHDGAIVNAIAVNSDNVLVSCADDGAMRFWDWKTGYCFQRAQAVAQPGSMDNESGILACTFDRSGSRLLTCGMDKTIKIYKENEDSTEETDPIDMVSWTKECRRRRKY